MNVAGRSTSQLRVVMASSGAGQSMTAMIPTATAIETAAATQQAGRLPRPLHGVPRRPRQRAISAPAVGGRFGRCTS